MPSVDIWLCGCVMQLESNTHISPLLTIVSSSSVVRASVLEHGGSWVRIPSGARIFSEFPVGSFVTPCNHCLHSLTLVVGWPHRSRKCRQLYFNDALVWLREAVMSYAVSRYLTLWLRDAARVKYPHFTLAHHRVSSSSVVSHPY